MDAGTRPTQEAECVRMAEPSRLPPFCLHQQLRASPPASRRPLPPRAPFLWVTGRLRSLGGTPGNREFCPLWTPEEGFSLQTQSKGTVSRSCCQGTQRARPWSPCRTDVRPRRRRGKGPDQHSRHVCDYCVETASLIQRYRGHPCTFFCEWETLIFLLKKEPFYFSLAWFFHYRKKTSPQM